MYKAIDLFAGIGGIRLGFDQAFEKDIDTVFVSEWDEKAQITYRENFHDPFPIRGDLTKIREADIPAHDILLAGFPCQAFSLAGKRRGFEDTRGTLFFDVERIARFHRPRVIFCENVKNLVNHDRGRTFRVIRSIFEKLGYRIFYKVLNSKDFGVPQHRERIYIVAFRDDADAIDFSFPEAAGTPACIEDIMESREVSPKYYLSDQYLQSLIRHKKRHEAKGHGFGFEIRALDDVAGALVCGGMGRERNLIVDTRLTDFKPVTHIKGHINRDFIRKMTPREWARLQGFPDSYRLSVADTHLYRQFGNSVTVPVIRAIAEMIYENLRKSESARPEICKKDTIAC
ncbi:DNA cytosine methyltransferase [Selenomonas sp. F0473]|uniref:DNA cytosine methyltransferase n=1 Tax=Selenomonas sp. F0473 TaxID=999423 RepID=UPI00029EAAC3|nr:DNA cytosine methyltransferase [Selenomonas sp. F0473]EKU71179.1 DNA (cytosine-5-)-methyltransferase [Selenomonas sp. F0473]